MIAEVSQLKEVNPLESPGARRALVAAYRALKVLDLDECLSTIDEVNPKAATQAREAIVALEEGMSPNLLCTVLPTYTQVTYRTAACHLSDEPLVGLLREGAGGHSRRITTIGPRGGWEHFIDDTTVFTSFEVTERA